MTWALDSQARAAPVAGGWGEVGAGITGSSLARGADVFCPWYWAIANPLVGGSHVGMSICISVVYYLFEPSESCSAHVL